MTEPNPPRAVPGPPRPGPGPADAEYALVPQQPAEGAREFGDLEERPVAEHVAVYEAEHARLRRELGTIDQL